MATAAAPSRWSVLDESSSGSGDEEPIVAPAAKRPRGRPRKDKDVAAATAAAAAADIDQPLVLVPSSASFCWFQHIRVAAAGGIRREVAKLLQTAPTRQPTSKDRQLLEHMLTADKARLFFVGSGGSSLERSDINSIVPARSHVRGHGCQFVQQNFFEVGNGRSRRVTHRLPPPVNPGEIMIFDRPYTI
jgi:hypothetical protein